MRTEFDGTAYDRWLMEAAEPDDSCTACDGSGWLGEAHCPDCGDVWGYGVEEESAAEARKRMTDDEREADTEWEKER